MGGYKKPKQFMLSADKACTDFDKIWFNVDKTISLEMFILFSTSSANFAYSSKRNIL
jgi:hypothetical protein